MSEQKQNAMKLVTEAGNLCRAEIDTERRIQVCALLKVALALLETEPPAGELKYCKEHRTIHCSCQQREIDALTAENKQYTDFVQELYRQEPSLKNEGLENFDGYWVRWDQVIKACQWAWENEHDYDESPLELITDLIEERDVLAAENKQLKGEAPIPGAWWKDCPDLAQRVMERIMEENNRVLVEKQAQADEIVELKARIATLQDDIKWLSDDVKAQAERMETLERQAGKEPI